MTVTLTSALGYARINTDIPEQTLTKAREDLAKRAKRQGYTLANVFLEQEDSGSSAFAALIEAAGRAESPVVVIPSIRHFASLPGLQAAMKDLIERETGARIVVLAPADLSAPSRIPDDFTCGRTLGALTTYELRDRRRDLTRALADDGLDNWTRAQLEADLAAVAAEQDERTRSPWAQQARGEG